ncbi:MAG: DUF2007 domain-containing protein [Winogradskyella sp.]
MNQTFVTIAKFQYSAEALIIKGRLEADGIHVFLRDNHTIDTDPLVSNAIGGVKLQVRSKDEEKAKAILKSIKTYSVDNDGNAINCPNCKSERIGFYSTIKDLKSFISFLVGFIFGALPFSTRYSYKCEDCNTEFSVK